MKFTLSWLKEFLETEATLSQITEKLTALGLEVEEVTDRSATLSAFKVAQIIDAKPHPDADKLRVCRVNTGTEELQIVCGAPNARAGINVVLAPVGSVIPTNGLVIKASKIRGVESFGMLCSAAELGLGNDHSGIIEMPACNDNLAKNYAEVAGLHDPVIEIAITPNRGDCLGVYGIARDLAAAGLGVLKPLQIPTVKGGFPSPVAISLKEGGACPYFIGRYFKGVKNAVSPEWLAKRLEAIGLRPISALVDITNYIAYTFGRPLHVYDAKKLQGNLEIRPARAGENFTALNENSYTLPEGISVVADAKNVQAVSGIIGGMESGCELDTTEVFLEVALFDDQAVAKAGRLLDIHTDSRYRFERRVDPAFLMHAAEIASRLILDLCGGEASELVIAGKEPDWQRSITFDWSATARLTGVDVPEAEAAKILEALGFGVEGHLLAVPSFRPDVEGVADIAEELVRIKGYDAIPTTALPWEDKPLAAVLSAGQIRVSQARRALAARGMNEAISWSFVAKDTARLFGGGNPALQLKNPISSEMDQMRPSILPGLLQAAGRNAARGRNHVALFEIGRIFENTSPEGQPMCAAGLRSGEAISRHPLGAARPVDVFDVKADVLAVLALAGVAAENLRVTTDAPSHYHPGRSGVLRLGKNALACFGELHPAVLRACDIRHVVAGFELFFDALPAPKVRKTAARAKFSPSAYQASVRDFAFTVDETLAADDILRSARLADKNLVESVALFDVYQGKGVEEGKKSVAFSIRIQPQDKTLTDEELEQVSHKVITAVEKLGGTLRK